MRREYSLMHAEKSGLEEALGDEKNGTGGGQRKWQRLDCPHLERKRKGNEGGKVTEKRAKRKETRMGNKQREEREGTESKRTMETKIRSSKKKGKMSGTREKG